MSEFAAVRLARHVLLSEEASADDYAEAVIALNENVAQHVLSQPDLKSGTKLRATLAAKDTTLTFRVFLELIAQTAPSEDMRLNLTFMLAKAIDDALNIGAFFKADPEDEGLPLDPLAEMARKGGRESGLRRNKEADAGWRAHAIELALEVRVRNPAIAQKPLASEIGEVWREEGFKPQFDALLGLIQQSEKNGAIPKRLKRR